MTTNIYLNVNDLVEQVIELTNKNNEAIREAREASEKLQHVERELLDLQVEKIRAKQKLEADLDEMAKQHEVSALDIALSKISNG
jgi:hypothetical protein